MRPANKQHSEAVLGQGAWFKALPPDLKALMLENSLLRTFKTGEVISAEDQPQAGLWGVVEGQVAVTRRVASAGEFFFHLGGPGFWFGEAGLITNQVALVTVTARTAGRTLFLPASKFAQITANNIGYFRCFVELHAARNALMLRHVAQSSGLSPESYLRIRLADISDLIHSDGAKPEPVELALSQTDVANMIGTSRQTVNKLLKKMEHEGLIKVSFRKISILDPARLRGGHRKTGL
jgi:CRP/FNR family transcriptional regulator, cyclic AMP receptor protein